MWTQWVLRSSKMSDAVIFFRCRLNVQVAEHLFISRLPMKTCNPGLWSFLFQQPICKQPKNSSARRVQARLQMSRMVRVQAPNGWVEMIQTAIIGALCKQKTNQKKKWGVDSMKLKAASGYACDVQEWNKTAVLYEKLACCKKENQRLDKDKR